MPTILIYYGHDAGTAKAMAASLRAGGDKAMVRHAAAFTGEHEPADRIVATPDVDPRDAARLVAVYGDVEGVATDDAGEVETPPTGEPDAEQPGVIPAAWLPRPEPVLDYDDMTDSELRALIRDRTGNRAGPRTSREKLIEAARAAGGV